MDRIEIKLIRMAHMLTQKELGKIIGVTGHTVHQYEKGKSIMPKDKENLLIEYMENLKIKK